MNVDGSEIDPSAVLLHFGWQAMAAPKRVVGGWDTLLFKFATPDGRPHALRIYRRPESSQAAAREVIALECCAGTDVPVPSLEAAGKWHDQPVMILSWSPGEPLLDAVQRRPWAIWRLANDFGRVQARLNALLPPEGLVTGAPEYWLDRGAEATREASQCVRDRGVVTDRLIHLDYHPLNVLSDGRAVTAVLDWTGGAAGDPRADFARTAALIRTGPIPPSRLRPILALGRRLLYEGWKRGYEKEAGPLEGMAPFMAWGGATALHDYEGAMAEGRGWAVPGDLGIARRWAAYWKAKARSV